MMEHPVITNMCLTGTPDGRMEEESDEPYYTDGECRIPEEDFKEHIMTLITPLDLMTYITSDKWEEFGKWYSGTIREAFESRTGIPFEDIYDALKQFITDDPDDFNEWYCREYGWRKLWN